MLRLLYTPNEDGVSLPVYGRTRIVKATFLLHRNLRENFNIDTGFDFEAYKYGPFDSSVFESLESLEHHHLIEIEPPEEHESMREEPKYKLTGSGEEYGGELWEALDPQQQKLLRWVRYEQANRPLGSLLSYVYRNYPDMTENSEISDQYS